MKKSTSLICFLFSFSILICIKGSSQLVVKGNISNASLISALSGPGVTISNLVVTGDTGQYGLFTENGGLGISSGVIMTSGNADSAIGPNDSNAIASTCVGTSSSDACIQTLTTDTQHDACIITFDVVPIGDSMTMGYVFGSEEYPDFVGSFDDVFGFFINGPNPAGGTYSCYNTALIPGTTTAVSINTVNANTNKAYYINNALPSSPAHNTIYYNGITVLLDAVMVVVPGQIYHVKLAITDIGDCAYDSGVFLTALTSTGNALKDSVKVTNTACGKSTGSAVVYAYGGIPAYSYSWSNGMTTSAITNVTAGSYTCTITDSIGDKIQPIILIADSSSLSGKIGVVSTITCNGLCNGSLDFKVNGGKNPYTYLWSNNNTDTTVDSLCAGLYSIQVSDSNGCIFSDTLTLTQPALLSASTTATPATICIGSSSTISATGIGGTGAYSYSWNTGCNTSSCIVSPTSTTTYTVIANDVSGCNATPVTVVVNVNPPLRVVTGSAVVECNGMPVGISAYANGGDGSYTYTWQPGSLTGQNVNVSPASTSYYTVSVQDACGTPMVADSAEVLVDPAFTVVSIDSNIAGSCNSSLWVVNSGGIKPYSYLWSNGETTDTATGLCSATYSVTVTDSNGCSVTDSVTISGPNGINELQNGSSIKIYPVPVSNVLNISITNSFFTPTTLHVFDITGRDLINMNLKLNSDKAMVDVSALEEGNYILLLTDQKKTVITRFTVVK